MKKCLFLVEGPYDKLRLSLIENLFDSSKLVIIPFETDKLQQSNYYLDIQNEIKAILSKEKTHDIDDFDCIVQVCDTDGCFIDSSKILENSSLKHTSYFDDHIETLNLKSFLAHHSYKIENINNILSDNNIDLYYNSTNIDHAFDGIRNPSKIQKKNLALKMYNKYKDDLEGFVTLLFDCLSSDDTDYIGTWNYIKKDDNSLSRASNLFVFLIKNYDDLKDEVKIIIKKLIQAKK